MDSQTDQYNHLEWKTFLTSTLFGQPVRKTGKRFKNESKVSVLEASSDEGISKDHDDGKLVES
jgi:hypothetical protein